MISRLSTTAALAHRDFRLVWSGLVVLNLGTWMQTFGQGWLVVQLAEQAGTPGLGPLYLGLVNLARGVPAVVFGLYGGVVADRVDRRRLLVIANVFEAAAASVLAILTLTGQITIGWVILLGALNAIPQAFDGTTRSAMLPRLVPAEHLLSAIGLMNAAWHGSILIGPLLGGLLIGPLGIGGLFVVKAAAHAPVIAAILLMREQPTPSGSHRRNPLGAIAEALGFVRRDAILLWAVVLTATLAFSIRPHTQLLPAFAHDQLHVGAQELSWLLAASGLGSFAGALLVAPLGRVGARGRMFLLASIATGILLSAFALQTTLVAALVCLTMTGLVTMVANGVASGFIQLRTPDNLRGRVMSLINVSFGGLNPIGAMTFGTLGSLVGIGPSIAVAGIAYACLGALALVFVAELRDARESDWADRPAGLEAGAAD